MGCELRVFEPSNKIKACLMTAKGMIGVVLQVYSSEGAGTPSMVEVRYMIPGICYYIHACDCDQRFVRDIQVPSYLEVEILKFCGVECRDQL